MLPTADRMVTEGKEEEMLDGPYGRIFERGGTSCASMHTGDVVRVVEAGPDRDCAESVLQLMKEGSR